MNVVLVGAGKVGRLLTELLVKEDHNIVVIDSDEDILNKLQEDFDVAIVHGNGATVEVQNEANVRERDLLIAATSGDEINLLCCVVANMLGAKHTVTRVRNPEYDGQIEFLRRKLGLDLALNPEKAAAQEVFRILQFPSFLHRDTFAGGRVDLVEWKLSDKSKLAGKKLSECRNILKINALVCAVERDGDVTIPSGNFVLNPGDHIMLAAESTQLAVMIQNMGLSNTQVKDVMIIGGGHISMYLAWQLLRSNVKVTIIERDRELCEELSYRLPKATIICGNGTEQDLLLGEGIRDMDAVVSLTGMDEENLMVSMFANSLHVPKTITKINRTEYIGVLNTVGIDTTVSPKLQVANEIMRYVRTIYEEDESLEERSKEGSIETLYRIFDGKAEALGFTVPRGAEYRGVTLKDLTLKPNILVANIVRGDKVIVPGGNDYMNAGDSVVVITTSGGAVSSLSDIFAGEYQR